MTTKTLDDLEINMKQCWRCSQCKWVPSLKDQRFNKICPSMEYGNFHAYSGGGKVITAYALRKGAVPYTETMLESVFACTMCGACDVGCKTNTAELVEPLDVLYALRAKVAADGESPPAHLAMIESLRDHGNPHARPAAERMRWADGLELKDASRDRVDVLLHVGCDSAYAAEQWPELQAIVALLDRAGVSFGVLPAECATGEMAFDLGFQDDARLQAEAMRSLIAQTGASTVVTCSAGSYAAFRNVWPRLGVQPIPARVRHIADLVDDLFETAALRITQPLDASVTYHDSCKLGRLSEAYVETDSKWTTVLNNWFVNEPAKPILFGNDGLYDAPRKLIARMTGRPADEMPRNRNAAWCCGGKGGAREAYPDFAAFAANERMAEARSTGAAMLVTASCACQRQLEQAARPADGASPDAATPAVTGLFSLLLAATAPARATAVA